MEVGGAADDDDAGGAADEEEGAAVLDGALAPAEPPAPGLGPAISVVSVYNSFNRTPEWIGKAELSLTPDSTKIPDQYQSSGSASVPPFGLRIDQ